MRFVLLTAFLFPMACGGNATGVAAAAMAAAPAVSAPAGPHTVVVFATASLRAPFTELAKRYEQDHPGAKVDLHVDGGAALFSQANAGAIVDVVAVGDSSLMSRFASSALLASNCPTELARNRVAIAVAKGNAKQVSALRDLVRSDVKLGLGARSSSIGRYGRWALTHQGLACDAKVETATADALLAKVQGGEVDAAIVYVTTLRGVEGVERIDVPAADNQPVLYSISATRTAAEPRGAAAFRAMALGDVGQAILREHGFLPIGAK
jgi:molybdate transport system substrate-binding protein